MALANNYMANTDLRELHLFGFSITNLEIYYIKFSTDPPVGIAAITIDGKVFND